MARPPGTLLDRRLVIVTGKGGTGKTTVAAVLALAAARAGRRVLVAEMGDEEQIHRLLAPDSEPGGYAGREICERVHAMRIDPFAALAEYLGMQLGVRAVVDRVIRNPGFRQLMGAAPGWRELITLGKVWHLEQQRDASDAPLYDLIVVDAPATGHGVTFLDVPRVVASAVRAGPLRQQAGRVEALIADPRRTLLLPVTLAEDLPTRETAELVARIRAGVGVAVDRIVVNGVFPRVHSPDLGDLAGALGRIPSGAALGGLPRAPVLAECVRHLTARHELNLRYTEEIGKSTRLPTVVLPYRTDGIAGPADLEPLADALVLEPGGGAR